MARERGKEMRIAYCMYGLAGGAKGKHGKGADPRIFQLGYKHANTHILSKNRNVDVFMHSWSVEYEDQLKELYQPVRSHLEPQKFFEVPKWIEGGRSADNKIDDRTNAHYSRWYSTKRVLELKQEFERESGFLYDVVMLTRYDLAWEKDIEFSVLDMDNIYFCHVCKYKNVTTVKYWHNPKKYKAAANRRHSHRGYPYEKNWGLWDCWTIASSENIDIFANVYDNLEQYCRDRRMQRKKPIRVSNHLLPQLCLEDYGKLKCVKLIFHHHEDCVPVRMKYREFHEGVHYR